MRRYQFNWIGRTKDGVSRWMGAPKGPSERSCKNLFRYGIAMSIVALIATGAMVMHLQSPVALLWLALLGGTHGLIFSLVGSWLLKMRRNLDRLKTAEELAEEFGSTPEAVQRLAEVRSIRARININDTNLYDPEEFIASRSLLRATSAPVTPETLLRPAQPTATLAPAETLLRPVEPVEVVLTPVQQLFYTTEEVEEDETTRQQYVGKSGSPN
ncbi:MAG TPA: hypothetical protein VKU00_31980 [Chthonomonadaceae bacterium]|nr:hypothetical protein [Chthonomonadaceae bacterium]